MIADIFHTTLYQPLYNGLVFLISVVPWGDVGIAVIVLTLFVKFLILPLTHKSTKAQARLREIEPEVRELKEKHKKDKAEQARQVMALYQKHGINPFSGCTLFLVQIPVIIALYWVFWKGLTNGVDESTLYSFVAMPEAVAMKFLGIFDMSGKSLVLAAFAGATQYYQMKLSFPFQAGAGDGKKNGKKDGPPSLKEEFMKNFQLQMKYGLPFIVFFVSYTISAAVALYWTVSNLFSIAHELLIRRRAKAITTSGADGGNGNAAAATKENGTTIHQRDHRKSS